MASRRPRSWPKPACGRLLPRSRPAVTARHADLTGNAHPALLPERVPRAGHKEA
jgi:hypothetical protein